MKILDQVIYCFSVFGWGVVFIGVFMVLMTLIAMILRDILRS